MMMMEMRFQGSEGGPSEVGLQLLVRATAGPLHLVRELLLDLFRSRRAILLLLPGQFRPCLRRVLDSLLVHRRLRLRRFGGGSRGHASLGVTSEGGERFGRGRAGERERLDGDGRQGLVRLVRGARVLLGVAVGIAI